MIILDLKEAAREARKLRDAEAARQQTPPAAVRSYQAGVVNRLTSDWVTSHTSTRAELRLYLRNIRARSRDLARNNDYLKKFLGMCRSNVIGPAGIRLQVRARREAGSELSELDRELNQMVETAWREWGRKENCSASHKLSWLDAQKLFIRTLARDGEALVRKVMTRQNRFGFTLKFIDVAWLDETFNQLLPGGNRIIMSVEVDDDERPLAYWLTPPSDEYIYPGAMQAGVSARQRVRVPASEIIHCFLTDDENQTRGLPWAHTAMLRLRMLGGYEEAELVAARAGACKGGFYKTPEDEQYSGDQAVAAPTENIEPGMTPILPPGWEFIEYDPNHPNTNFSGFVKGVLRGVSAGLEVAYNSLANDLEGVNFSSIRAGLLEERDIWRGLQLFTIEHFCVPIYTAWLEAAWLSGALEFSASDFDRIQEPLFQPRGWAWVDPLKDVQANILAINHGLRTRTQTLAEQGEDFEETVLLLAQEQQILDENEIRIISGTPAKESMKEQQDD